MKRDLETYEIIPAEDEGNLSLRVWIWFAVGIPLAGLFLTVLLMAALIILVISRPANAHEWYDRSCCSERDCYPVSVEEVEALPNGDWKIKETGEIFSGPNGKSMQHVRFSPDGKFHRCSWNGDRKLPSICLYIPLPNGS